jgi:hypothetical protein
MWDQPHRAHHLEEVLFERSEDGVRTREVGWSGLLLLQDPVLSPRARKTEAAMRLEMGHREAMVS